MLSLAMECDKKRIYYVMTADMNRLIAIQYAFKLPYFRTHRHEHYINLSQN